MLLSSNGKNPHNNAYNNTPMLQISTSEPEKTTKKIISSPFFFKSTY